MVSHLFFYQLALIALVWLFFLLLYAWPSDRTRRPHPAAPIAPHRPRPKDPKPFAGLTEKPHCALCEQDISHPQAPPAVCPDPLPPTHRRPRRVDTSQHFCPHTGCRYHGWRGLGNLRANGHPSGGPWRQFHCTACDGYFPEHHGTIFHGKQAAVELMVHVLACLAEGLGIRATARVFEVAPNTVLDWLVAAAEQLRAFSAYFLCEVHVKQLQLDELYAVLSAVKDGEISEAKAVKRLSRSPHWVWVAIDPVTKLPRWMPLPQLLYAQVVKTTRRRRLVDVTHRVVFGTLEAVNQVLRPLGWHINTSLVERFNLSLRQHVAALGRRTSTLCKGEAGLRQQLALYHVYYNFVLLHASLRLPSAEPIGANGTGSATVWRSCTPAMAAGLTDHVWTLKEVLMFRVPPWPQPQTV